MEPDPSLELLEEAGAEDGEGDGGGGGGGGAEVWVGGGGGGDEDVGLVVGRATLKTAPLFSDEWVVVEELETDDDVFGANEGLGDGVVRFGVTVL